MCLFPDASKYSYLTVYFCYGKNLKSSALILPDNTISSVNKLPVAEHEFRNEFGRIYCSVSYLPKSQAIVAEWHGYSTKTQVELVMNWVEQRCKINPSTTMVNDCSNIKSVWFDTIEWFSRIWVQKMKHLGLQNFIHIANPGSFGDRIGEQLQEVLADQVQFYRTDLRIAAINWLESR